MIRHIIMFKFTDVLNDSNRLSKAEKMKSSFSQMKSLINVVKSYDVKVNMKKTDFSYDVVIQSEYDSWEDLDIYLKHTEHQKAIAMCKDIKKEKAVIDYEY
ncbi:MAG: hypothetical protein GQ564_05700 [Bacteroidales bacterium]|nr:hypothetical protein [Bacteroidales bacterium]